MAKIDNYKINIDETPKRNFVAKPQNLATLLNNVAKNRSNKEIKGFRDYEFVKYFPEIHVLCILINIGGTIIFMILSEFLIRVCLHIIILCNYIYRRRIFYIES